MKANISRRGLLRILASGTSNLPSLQTFSGLGTIEVPAWTEEEYLQGIQEELSDLGFSFSDLEEENPDG